MTRAGRMRTAGRFLQHRRRRGPPRDGDRRLGVGDHRRAGRLGRCHQRDHDAPRRRSFAPVGGDAHTDVYARGRGRGRRTEQGAIARVDHRHLLARRRNFRRHPRLGSERVLDPGERALIQPLSFRRLDLVPSLLGVVGIHGFTRVARRLHGHRSDLGTMLQHIGVSDRCRPGEGVHIDARDIGGPGVVRVGAGNGESQIDHVAPPFRHEVGRRGRHVHERRQRRALAPARAH